MRFAPRWRWIVSFALLVLALHEAHELAHTWTGRLICGDWGWRDFNTWSLAEGCTAPLATVAGPALTYAVLWLGAGLVARGDERMRSLGLALLFASNPFGRLLTVAAGGGDELVVVTALGGSGDVAAWLGTTVGVSAVILVPLRIGWRAMRPVQRRAMWFAALFFGPTLLVIAVLLVSLNGLLARGFGSTPVILGEPLLVLVSTALVLAGAAGTSRWLTDTGPAR